MESSRWTLVNDVAEQRLTLKNNRNTYHPPFWFLAQNRYSISRNGVLFLLCVPLGGKLLPK